MDLLTASSVDNLLRKSRSSASRALAEFSKYDAMELVDALQKAAHDARHEKESYYRLAYESLREKLGYNDALFRIFLLPLFGDKDHEKILDLVAKVEKGEILDLVARPYLDLRCFGCNRFGHIRIRCPHSKGNNRETLPISSEAGKNS